MRHRSLLFSLFIYPVKATGRGTKLSSMKRNPVPYLFWCFFLLCVFFYDNDIIFCLFLILLIKIQCVVNLMITVFLQRFQMLPIFFAFLNFKGTVSWDRFQKFWQKLTELNLTMGRGWFLNFLWASMILKHQKYIFFAVNASLRWLING